MSLAKLLNVFYRLPLEVIAQAFLLLALGYVMLWRRYGCRREFRWGSMGLLAVWLGVALHVTVTSRVPGEGTEVIWIPLYYLWELHSTGNQELIRSTFMNVALFFPAGLLVASLLSRSWPKRRKAALVIGLFFVLSAMIELTQLFWNLGRVEVDDLLHNTLGAFLGALPVLCESGLFGPRNDSSKS